MVIFNSYVKLPEGTLWSFAVAMDNAGLIDDFPMKMIVLWRSLSLMVNHDLAATASKASWERKNRYLSSDWEIGYPQKWFHGSSKSPSFLTRRHVPFRTIHSMNLREYFRNTWHGKGEPSIYRWMNLIPVRPPVACHFSARWIIWQGHQMSCGVQAISSTGTVLDSTDTSATSAALIHWSYKKGKYPIVNPNGIAMYSYV